MRVEPLVGVTRGRRPAVDRDDAHIRAVRPIRAFNADMPWTQFVQWQLAGDEFAQSLFDDGGAAVARVPRPPGIRPSS